MRLRDREFIGVIKKVYGGDKYGLVEVMIPELIGDDTIVVYDASQKNIIDSYSGTYIPLLEGQRVVIKFKNDNINSGYIDRKYEGNVFKLGKEGVINKGTYIICQTPKNHSIKIDENNNSIEIKFSGGESGIKISDKGVEISSGKKIKIRATDEVEITSTKSIQLHQGSPVSGGGAGTNPNLNAILNNIQWAPDTYIDQQIYKSTITALQSVELPTTDTSETDGSEYNNIDEYIKTLLEQSPEAITNIKNDIIININSVVDNELILSIQTYCENYESLEQSVNQRKENINNQLNELTQELKDKINQYLYLKSQLPDEKQEKLTENGADDLIKFAKYFHYKITGNNDFEDLTEEDILKYEEENGDVLKPLSKDTMDKIESIVPNIQNYVKHKLNEAKELSNLVKEKLNYIFNTSIIVPKTIKAALENLNEIAEKEVKEIQEAIDKISEGKIISCDDNKKLDDILNVMLKSVKQLNSTVESKLSVISESFKNLGNQLSVTAADSSKSILDKYISIHVSSNLDEQIINIKNELAKLSNDIVAAFNKPINIKKNSILEYKSRIKTIASSLVSNPKNAIKEISHSLSGAVEVEYNNVICSLLEDLSNFALNIDFNFGLDIRLPDWLIEQIPLLELKNLSELSKDATFFGGACVDFDPCKKFAFSYGLNIVIPNTNESFLDILLKILTDKVLKPIVDLINSIIKLINQIKLLIAQLLTLNIGFHISLNGAIFKDLLDRINSFKINTCITTKTINLTKLVSSEIENLPKIL